LITGIIIILLLIPIWYTMLAPSMIISELEKIDSTTSFEGTFGKIEYIGTKGYIYDVTNNSDLWEIPITVAVHAYVTEVKGESVTLRIDVTMTERDSGAMLPDPFSRNSTYVFNKFTLENVKDHSDADKPREGYDPLYPLHLKAGENITNAWLDNLNITATLEFKESINEEGLTLYKYFVNETITGMTYVPSPIGDLRNCTLTSTKTILLEPLSGLLVYTEEEIFDWIWHRKNMPDIALVYIEYESTAEAKTQGLADAKTAHEALQLAELYLPSLLGVIAIILIVSLAFNVRRLVKKKAAHPTHSAGA